MSLAIRIPEGTTRHPGRHEVVDAFVATSAGEVPVVVKKVRVTARQRAGATRAEKSLAVARRLLEIGVPTPEPLGVERRDGESWYVCRRVEGASQIRAWFLHRDDPSRFPEPAVPASFEEVVAAVARLARRMHEGGVFFRDFTDGNVLVTRDAGELKLWLVDLDRARPGRKPVGSLRRLRDLARLGLNRAGDRAALLRWYHDPEPVPSGRGVLLSALRHRIVGWDALKRALRPWRRSPEESA